MRQPHSPNVVTKQLAFNRIGGKRKVRLSTNFLQLMGFIPGECISITPNNKALQGFSISPSVSGTHKVYSRKYRRARTNNPLESIVEFSNISLLDNCFPSYTERFHVDMRHNQVVFTPMANRVHSIHKKLSRSKLLSAFVGLTGGVDIHCIESLGWKAEIVLEHRPQEARDVASGRNLSEVHALNTLLNGSPSILINENIYEIEMARLERILTEAPPVTLCHYSLGCDDHSTAKSKRAKEFSLKDLSTMYDMVYPVLKQIELISPAVILIENVKQFASSGAGKILGTTLKRLGYNVTEMTLNSLDYGARQGRERYYLVASIYPGFEPPKALARTNTPLRKMIESHLPECREVTNNRSIAARSTKKRNMPNFITVDSLFSPTFMKSQDRGISDAVYIKHEGRIYKPSISLMKKLMSIPDDFNVAWMAKEQATETLGQSIDYVLHHSVMKQVTYHVNLNIGPSSIVRFAR